MVLSPTTAFTAALVSILGGGSLWSRSVRLAPQRHGGEQDSSVGMPLERHAWPIVMPSVLGEVGAEQAHTTAEVIAAELLPETLGKASAEATAAVSLFEAENELSVIETVDSVPFVTFGEGLADYTIRAENDDHQPIHSQVSKQDSKPSLSESQMSNEADHSSDFAAMLVSLVLVFSVSILWFSCFPSHRQKMTACQSQTVCTGAHVPIPATPRRPDTMALSALLSRAAGDNEEEIWEMPSPGAEGRDCGVFDDEPRLQGSVEVIPSHEHKCAADALSQAVSRVATPSRVRSALAGGEHGSDPRQSSF